MKCWMSLDIAQGKTGVTVWEDNRPVVLARLIYTAHKQTKKVSARQVYHVHYRSLVDGAVLTVEYGNEKEAWGAIRNGRDIQLLVIEAGFIQWAMAGMVLAEARGRALALLGACGANPPEVIKVAPPTWRKGLKSALKVDIPSNRDGAKRAAVELCRQLTGTLVTDDEAEAYLIGRWALETGRV